METVKEPIAAANYTWRSLYVEKVTLSGGPQAVYLPPPPGVRVGIAMGVVSFRDHRQPRHKEVIALPDHACITPPGWGKTLVFTPKADGGATVVGITIPTETFSRVMEEEGHGGTPDDLTDIPAAHRADPVLAAVARAVVTAYEAGADDLYAESAAQFLATHLVTPRTVADRGSRGTLGRRQLETVTSYMREHFGDPITLDDLSALTSYSRYHFTRCFKAATGRTPYRYLNEIRIEMARTYLESSGDTVLHIGRKCGFGDPRGFTRNFRHIVGCTPSQYRAMRG
ncbi:AraC family transcriptional regulator [Streptomyces sp. TS71-3]|uniref:helix-turn-helix transcriptional regulator n=1 Tax=Streptomyces sp. TS71-3 TaxID=2733862 RepID=UPI001B2DF4E0|nr:AraC family transcriptional regulator [Streptomyces sp. TS71-3]GHJ41532.1 hypothetical protein Sm713_71410 [Streptomyces sp. TS71-3]